MEARPGHGDLGLVAYCNLTCKVTVRFTICTKSGEHRVEPSVQLHMPFHILDGENNGHGNIKHS